MKNSLAPCLFFRLCGIVPKAFGVALLFGCASASLDAADPMEQFVNQDGASVIGAQGDDINYDRKTLEAMV